MMDEAIQKAEQIARDVQMRRYLVAASRLNDLIALLKRMRGQKKGEVA